VNGHGERLLRTRELAEKLNLSSATVLRRHKLGTMPPGFLLSSNALRWRESEIDAWLESTRSGNLITSDREVPSVRRLDTPSR